MNNLDNLIENKYHLKPFEEENRNSEKNDYEIYF